MKKIPRKVVVAIQVLLILAMIAVGCYGGWLFYQEYILKRRLLEAMIQRLSADTRIAEDIVTDVKFNPITEQHMTTIKFLEYNSSGQPMEPQYYSFQGNIIQFQSLVIRFDDLYIKSADSLRGKSAYLFWKVFVLNGVQTQEYVITDVHSVPAGYKIPGPAETFEERLWQEFWDYALNSDKAISKGIKNAQIEAPGTKFIPGNLYTLKIEHDGGIRIDVKPIPEILRGERIGTR